MRRFTSRTFSICDQRDGFPAIEIYAELLRNIRAISIVISLHKSFSSASATISPEGDGLAIRRDDAERRIKLPCRPSILKRKYANSPLAISKSSQAEPNSDFEEYVARIPLPDATLDDETDDIDDSVPWNADNVSNATGFSCERCNHNLLRTQRVATWQDLPHDDWAEMMDLWHCHKPHEKEPNGNREGAEKGYSANEGIVRVKDGMGYVGAAYVLVAKGDFGTSVNVSEA